MSQVTIYLDSATEAAARQAAARAKLSLSRWFAQFAEAEKNKLSSDRDGFWAEIDRLRAPEDDKRLDTLLDPRTRYAGLSKDRPLAAFD